MNNKDLSEILSNLENIVEIVENMDNTKKLKFLSRLRDIESKLRENIYSQTDYKQYKFVEVG